jgi:DNA-directed RNA polymerase specialized sigma24 family protein
LVSIETPAAGAAVAIPAHGPAIEAADLIQRFYASLDAPSQAVFLLTFVEQLAAPALGAELGLSPAAVQRRVRALRAGLERFVAEQVPNG